MSAIFLLVLQKLIKADVNPYKHFGRFNTGIFGCHYSLMFSLVCTIKSESYKKWTKNASLYYIFIITCNCKGKILHMVCYI